MFQEAEAQAGIKRLTEEGGGTLELVIVSPGTGMELMMRKMWAGDKKARKILSICEKVVKKIAGLRKEADAVCACCDNSLFHHGFSIAIVAKSFDLPETPGGALTFCICDECGTTEPQLKEKASQIMQRVWPHSTSVDITHPEGGHA